jgi:hypothetical protein
MRDLFWARYISEGRETLEVAELDAHFSAELIAALGFVKQQSSSRRIRAHETYVVPPNVGPRIEELALEGQAEIDRIAVDLYGG